MRKNLGSFDYLGPGSSARFAYAQPALSGFVTLVALAVPAKVLALDAVVWILGAVLTGWGLLIASYVATGVPRFVVPRSLWSEEAIVGSESAADGD